MHFQKFILAPLYLTVGEWVAGVMETLEEAVEFKKSELRT